MTSASFWNYYKDEVNDPANEIDGNDNKVNNDMTTTSKPSEYKTNLIGRTADNASRLNAGIVVPLKYLSNFWRSKYCLISEISRTSAMGGANPADATLTTGGIFYINNARLYIPVVALSVNDNIIFLGNIKQEFNRTVSWSKYRFEMKTQTKNNNFYYLIDPKIY